MSNSIGSYEETAIPTLKVMRLQSPELDQVGIFFSFAQHIYIVIDFLIFLLHYLYSRQLEA
jgi:hypothetical protein